MFFQPYVGSKFYTGIHGKKVLVLGASFYCAETDCRFFEDCTSVIKKDSSKYDTICPQYAPHQSVLHDEPSNCIEIQTKLVAYQKFAKFMNRFVSSNVWDYMAFTNNVQFMLGSTQKGRRRLTYKSDLSQRDFDAFNEVLKVLQPDILVIWGTVINSRLKEENAYIIDPQELSRTESYVCHIQPPGVQRPVALINPYHPSSSAWYGDIPLLDKYMNKLLGL